MKIVWPIICLQYFGSINNMNLKWGRHWQRKDDSDDVTAAREGRRREKTASFNQPPSPPPSRGQCEGWRMCGPIWPPPWKGGDKSGRRCRTWLPMVSLEPAWKDASIDTSNSLIRGPWGRQNYFWLNRRNLWPPKSDTAADGLIETANTLIRGPWGPRHHFDTNPPFPAKSISLIEPLPLGIVVIYNTVILSWGRLYMTYTLSMVQKKIIFRLIRPK